MDSASGVGRENSGDSVLGTDQLILNKAKDLGKNMVHFCPDWDFMPIWQGTPEFDSCCCDKKLLSQAV